MLYETAVQTRLVPAITLAPSDQSLVVAPPALPELVRRYTFIEAIAHRLPVRYAGHRRLFSPINGYHHRVYNGRETDWVFVPMHEDPRFHSRFGFRAPRRVIATLTRIEQEMRRAGIQFDTLWVAHEAPRGVVHEGEAIPEWAVMPPPSKSVAAMSQQYGQDAATWFAALRGAASSAVTAPLAVFGALAILDPIIFGVMVGEGRPVEAGEEACFYYLVHWRDDEEA